ncbi:MAG: hypothetical protein EBR82_78525, partial [Caulobacteraceae bacterium]|nr:hypothetical protein [Caulobacteraceae bacterium]
MTGTPFLRGYLRGESRVRAVYKKCPECRKFLEARKFYKHPDSPDGLMAWCKSCMNCGTVRERPVYNDGERLLGDPSEEQI